MKVPSTLEQLKLAEEKKKKTVVKKKGTAASGGAEVSRATGDFTVPRSSGLTKVQQYYKNNVKSRVFTNYANLKKMQRSALPDEVVAQKEREEEKYDASDDESLKKDYLDLLALLQKSEYERAQQS